MTGGSIDGNSQVDLVGADELDTDIAGAAKPCCGHVVQSRSGNGNHCTRRAAGGRERGNTRGRRWTRPARGGRATRCRDRKGARREHPIGTVEQRQLAAAGIRRHRNVDLRGADILDTGVVTGTYPRLGYTAKSGASDGNNRADRATRRSEGTDDRQGGSVQLRRK